jgi:Zn-dependent protease
LFSRRLAPSLAAIAAFLAKFKTARLLVPKLKLFTTAGTMLVSIAAYSFVFGWRFAFGFVTLLFVHEMGHVIQLRREGIKASAPMFVPFLGALISARSLGDSALAEARVGLAGPVLGAAASAVCILIWHATGADIWRALAFTGLFLNMFNLLPVIPLDGGRAMAAMADVGVVRGPRGDDSARPDLSQPDHPDHRRIRRAGDDQALAQAT